MASRGLVGLGALFVAAQFYQPAVTTPSADPARAIEARLEVPPAVSAIFARSCRDCHSYKTRWPWYNRLSPASWLLASHVREGREHMNLSDWAQYDEEDAADLLEEMCELTTNESMPLPSYLLMHRGARLGAEDVRTLCEWTTTARARLERAR